MFSEIIISVTDVDAAIGFYTDACRFKHVRTVTHEGAKVAELDAFGQRVTLVAGERPGIQLVMETSNIRAGHRRLTRLGVARPDEAATVEGGQWLPFADPDGNPLAYWKPTEEDGS
jgi:catechol 2,3-dioxygenase-like lactoylglutathione lyase family enzyme